MRRGGCGDDVPTPTGSGVVLSVLDAGRDRSGPEATTDESTVGRLVDPAIGVNP